jgi:hypothetical protein
MTDFEAAEVGNGSVGASKLETFCVDVDDNKDS